MRLRISSYRSRIRPRRLRERVDEDALNKRGERYLKAEDVGGFNSLRKDNPSWIPDFSGANFSRKRLQDVNLKDALLVGCNFERADLSHANLKGADLSDSTLSYADLTKADLRGASLEYARGLENADLDDAYLSGANLRGTALEEEEIQRKKRRGLL